jgi:hypothetical protein
MAMAVAVARWATSTLRTAFVNLRRGNLPQSSRSKGEE